MTKRISRWVSLLSVFFTLAAYCTTAEAVLKDVGQINPANGFPIWYRDTSTSHAGFPLGLPLQQCLSQTISPFAAAGGGFLCNLLPDPGPPVFDPANPAVFPTHFPSEIFWWSGDAIINVDDPGNTTGISGGLVLGLEGAFGGGPVLAGDQVSFSRLRLRVNTVNAGNYRVIHPFGVNTFNDVPAGTNAINFTEDIGLGAPGEFKGALGGKIGPFLVWTPDPGPDTPTNPDGTITVQTTNGPETYIGDPNINHTVSGSPFGTNFFRIERLAADGQTVVESVQTDLFSITGKIYPTPIPTPLIVDRATYGRNNTLLHVDVFATAGATANTGLPSVLQLTGTGLTPANMLSDNGGRFYLHTEFVPGFVLPGLLTVTNTADNAPVPANALLTDEVTITQSSYNPVSKVLTIAAVSSDTLTPPALNATGFGPLVAGQLFISNVTIPPATVTVVSAAGGKDTEPVIVNPQNQNSSPVAVNDAADVAAGGTAIIDVATNDTDPDPGDSVVRASVTVATQGAHGTATANGNGTITYAALTGFTGTDSFTYTIQDTGGAISTAATVTMNIIDSALNAPPLAVDDTATTTEDSAVTFSVTGNDTDPNGNLAPGTIAITAQPANGSAVANAGGSVTYTPALNFNGSNTFTYTVKDTIAAVSNTATVTVTVTPANDPPIANNDVATTSEETPVTVSVTTNDTDLDGAVVAGSVVIVTQPANGQAVPNPDGTVTYAPNANFFGTDTFTYTVSDGLATSNTATVTVTVTSVNDPPTAVDDVATTVANTSRIINVIANDTDIDGTINAGSIVIGTQPLNGSATANPNGTVTYTPTAGFTGTNTFTYNVKDNGNAVSNNATVTVNVTSASAETVNVLRAQFRTGTREWLVEGTVTNGTPAGVTLHIGRDLNGPILGTAPVSGGRWRFQLPGTPTNPVPDASGTISVQSSGGGSRLAFPVAIR